MQEISKRRIKKYILAGILICTAFISIFLTTLLLHPEWFIELDLTSESGVIYVTGQDASKEEMIRKFTLIKKLLPILKQNENSIVVTDEMTEENIDSLIRFLKKENVIYKSSRKDN